MIVISADQLNRYLEILGQGGGDALALFTDVGRLLYEATGDEGLVNWVTAAAPALPEDDRNKLIMALMRVIFEESSSSGPTLQ